MKTYTISETAQICGLPDSTLRYYERIGLIERINRDTSSKQRVYSQDDVDHLTMIACLSATGMSIADMRSYLSNRRMGADKAREQAELLTTQRDHLAHEIEQITARIRYVEAKIAYWHAVEQGDPVAIAACGATTNAIADEMNLPRSLARTEA